MDLVACAGKNTQDDFNDYYLLVSYILDIVLDTTLYLTS